MKNLKTIYMDYQASTPINNVVLQEMLPFFTTDFANPHSADHVMGWRASKAVEFAREQVSNSICAEQQEIIFTSGATESNNHAIKSILRIISSLKKRILVGATEHKCVLAAATYAAEQYGLIVDVIPVDKEGFIDKVAYQNMLGEDVGLVCIMLVNNEIGTIQDIAPLVELAKSYGALFHCDAAQAPIAIDIDVNELGIDSLSLSAHKIYGPKGIGALYITADLAYKIEPIIHGGNQQNGYRAGTLSTPLCVGFGTACKLISTIERERERLRYLKSIFISELSKNVDFEINGPINYKKCHPGNINLYFPSMDANSLLLRIQPKLCASTGSACNSGFIESSYVIKALGYDAERARNSVRFSIGSMTSEDEIVQAVKIISNALNIKDEY